MTTQLSGLVGMPRRTFMVGLVPGVAAYQAVFITLGAVLGKPAWMTIEHYSKNPAVLALVVLTVIALALVGHALTGRSRHEEPRPPARKATATLASRPSISS